MAERKSGKWKVLQLRGLRQRWIFNTVMPVLVLLILIVVLLVRPSGILGKTVKEKV